MKKPWQSRTIWAALLTAVSAFYPPVGEVFVKYPQLSLGLIGLVFGLLRLDTKSEVKVKK